MPTVRMTPEDEARLVAKGATVTRARSTDTRVSVEGKAGRKLVEPAFVQLEKLCYWYVPLYVSAGDNYGSRDRHRRIGRSGHEKRAVHKALSSPYSALTPYVDAAHMGVTIRLVRLGPRTMDYSNVVASLKYVQDAVAERFGLDDADPAFLWDYKQEHSPAYGVRIEISL